MTSCWFYNILTGREKERYNDLINKKTNKPEPIVTPFGPITYVFPSKRLIYSGICTELDSSLPFETSLVTISVTVNDT